MLTLLPIALVLGVGGYLMVTVNRQVLLHGTERTARERADTMEKASMVVYGGVKHATEKPLPAPGLEKGVEKVRNRSGTGQLIQVVDPSGHVVMTSGDGSKRKKEPLLNASQLARARHGGTVYVQDHHDPILVVGQKMRLDRTQAESFPGGRVNKTISENGTVLVGLPITDVERSSRQIAISAAVGLPVLLLLIAVVVWRVVGSAMRPVARLRRGARRIASSDQNRRLPVPAARDEIHELAVTLNEMLDRLAAASERQRAFTTDAAHELRSPLASVRAQLEVALAHPGGQDWQHTAADVLADVNRLSRLSEDLLALARLDANLNSDGGRAGTELMGLTATVAERFENSRVPVELQACDSVTAAAPAQDLDRVLTNLVANAVRHAASRVNIAVDVEPGWAVLTVTDDGPGIPEADRDRVFQRFTRLDDARDSDAGGAGLGLAIVAETVHRYGGRVTLSDAEPGLAATVRIPRRIS